MKYYVFAEDLVAGLIGPFDTWKDALKHVHFCEDRGDVDPGIVITEVEAEEVRRKNPGILELTPEKDRKTRA